MPKSDQAPDVVGNLKKKRAKTAEAPINGIHSHSPSPLPEPAPIAPLTPEQRFKDNPFERLMMAMVWPKKITRTGYAISLGHYSSYYYTNELENAPERADPVPMDQAEEFIAKGREASFDLGASSGALDRLSADPELTQAFCRLALGGCVDMAYYGSKETAPIRSLIKQRGGSAAGFERSVGSLSKALFTALSGDQPDELGGSALRSALIALAGDDKAWEGASDRGELEVMAGLEPRSSPLRCKKGRSIVGAAYHRLMNDESSPKGAYSKSAGQLTEQSQMELYLKEQEGFESAIPKMMAKAFELCAQNPLLWAPYGELCAERLALGFDGVGASASLEELLPSVGALEPEIKSKTKLVMSARMRADLLKEGLAGEIAIAATQAFKLTAKDAHGLVGEAKKALLERSGLTAGAWKIAIANPMASAALIEGLEHQKKIAASSAGKAARLKIKAKTAGELQKSVEEGERRVAERFSKACQAASESLKIDAVSRALAAGASAGVSPLSLERMLLCALTLSREDSWRGGFMIDILAGRSPAKKEPTEKAGDTCLRLADVAAIKSQTAVWVKCFCEQIDARFNKQLALRGRNLATAGKPGLRERARVVNQWETIEPKEVHSEPPSVSEMALREAVDGFNEDLRLMSDFLSATEEGYFSGLPDKFGWSMAMRHQAQWHYEVAQKKAESSSEITISWAPAIGSARDGDFSVVELVNGRMLFDEGAEMKHCVSSYTSRCEAGESRIFSIRKYGARISTLELAPLNAQGRRSLWDGKALSRDKITGWEMVQNKGRHNALVFEPDTIAFCRRVVEMAGEADVAQRQENKRGKEPSLNTESVLKKAVL